MTIEELKQFQDNTVEWAKHMTQKFDDVPSTSFLLAYKSNAEKLKEMGDVEVISPKGFFASLKDHAVIGIVCPWKMNWKNKFGVLYREVVKQKPDAAGLLAALIAKGKELRIDDEYMRVARPLMEVLNVEDKDLIVMMLRQLCEVVEAFAICNTMMGWLGTDYEAYARLRESNKTLADDPASIEVLHVNMESHLLNRMITVPVHRRPGKARGEGKVRGWGKLTEQSSEHSPDFQMEGRFSEFLKPLRPTEKA